jgi:hypothetical protein
MDRHSGRQGSIYWRVAAASVGAAALFVFPCCFPANFLAALPCAQVRARLGPFYGWLASGLAGCAVALTTGILYGPSSGFGFGLFFIGVLAAPAVVMTGWVERGVRTDHAILAGFLVCLLLMAVWFLLFTLEVGVTPGEFVNRRNRENISLAREMLSDGDVQQMLGPKITEQLQGDTKELLDNVEEKPGMMGNFIYAMSGIWFLCGLSAIAAIMSRSRQFGAPERFWPPDSLRVIIPDLAVYPFIICGLLTLVRIDALRAWCYNIMIILAFMYFLCGVSIFAWFMIRLGMPLVFKILFSLLVLSYPPFILILVGVGLFDQWFDFRKLRLSGSGEPPDAPADGG